MKMLIWCHRSLTATSAPIPGKPKTSPAYPGCRVPPPQPSLYLLFSSGCLGITTKVHSGCFSLLLFCVLWTDRTNTSARNYSTGGVCKSSSLVKRHKSIFLIWDLRFHFSSFFGTTTTGLSLSVCFQKALVSCFR